MIKDLKKMKTIREWFELLPEEIKLKAINYLKKEEGNNADNFMDNIERDTMLGALTCSFIFVNTKEGHSFWYDLGENFKK